MPETIQRCRSCSAPIWWRQNASGKYQPMDFDLVTNDRSSTPHHATCPQSSEWKRKQADQLVDKIFEP